MGGGCFFPPPLNMRRKEPPVGFLCFLLCFCLRPRMIGLFAPVVLPALPKVSDSDHSHLRANYRLVLSFSPSFFCVRTFSGGKTWTFKLSECDTFCADGPALGHVDLAPGLVVPQHESRVELPIETQELHREGALPSLVPVAHLLRVLRAQPHACAVITRPVRVR